MSQQQPSSPMIPERLLSGAYQPAAVIADY